ncbi:MAG: Ig-like domain-containing protein, partial [Bacilli bacterium]|nr:Ig-like domain-containing protein [Bacilli bacterium]
MGTKPSKVEYQLGESLDVTGGIILAKYQDGTQDNIGITKEMVAVSDISTEGTKTVTVSYTYKGVTKTTSYEVTYKAKALQVSAVAFDKDTEVVRVGSAIILNPTISPSSLTRNDLIWTSSNNSVATVSNMGIVTGISNGGVTITATSKTDDSIKATIKVYVLLNVSSSQVSVSYANYTYDATTDTLTILSGGTWPSFNEPGILDGTLASLIIANSVGEGEVTVSNLTVTGDTTINGGGKNSVIFSSCTLKNIVINKIKTNDEQPVRVQIDETTEVQSDISILATGTAGAIITSNSPVMKVYAGSDVQLTGTSVVNELEITGSDIEASVAVPLTTLTVASTGTNASITASSPVENTIIGAAATLSATANLNNVTINAPTTLTSSAQVNTITAGANVVYGGSGNVTNLDINTANVAATLNGNVTAVNVTVTGANVSGTGSLGLIKTNNSLTVGMDTTLQNTSASNIQVTNSTSTNSVAVPTSNVVTINSTTTESSKVASVKTGGTVSASNAVAGYDAIKLGLYDQAEQTAIKSRYASLLATLTGPSADTALACKTYLVDTATATPYIKKFEVAGDGTNYTDYTAVAVSGNGNIVINYNLINAEAYAPTYKYTYVIADSDDVDILDEEVAVAAANFKNTANDANM